ncbi:hypothetical protein ACFQNJ_00540 [Hydrogenophaga bisanensis]|uniref:Lipoprotein n=1 Tax=Hydrogenophaga bisanensis TaxID=439611 RepID=A0ABW2R3V4_9BURK
MNQFMQAVVSTMKTQKSYRSVVALVATACASVLLSACIGGGGDSSSDDVDLLAAYEKIEGCMDRNDLIRVVGMAPNDVDASNTMIWEAGKYRLMVFLQLWDSGLYIASTKYLIGPGADRQTVIDSCED